MLTSSASRSAPDRRRLDVRGRALTITIVATLALGFAIARGPELWSLPPLPDLRFSQLLELKSPQSKVDDRRLRARFEQGVMMLHMHRYDYALTAFHEVLSIAPEMPEAHVNMGFALLGLKQWQQARDFFEAATSLRRDQINAYYGLAIALDELGDVPGAIGAMQSYIHRAPQDDPFRTRAESALWEWRNADRGEGSSEAAATNATPTTVTPASK
jgi:tetratricopeptide (TPR) repeat protein